MRRTSGIALAILASALVVGLIALVSATTNTASSPQTHTSPPADRPIELTVFAAASLTEAYRQIGANFEAANPGVKVVFNFAGSQQLAQQIAQGAPADVFASANQSQLDAVVRSGRITADASRVFVTNKLVVITAREAASIARLQDLATPGVTLVLAAKTVPVGQYALDFLDKASQDPAFGPSYRTQVEANIVSYEENVRAVLAKVALGEADAGIVYVTDVIANPNSQVRQIEIPADLNVIASYPIAPLNDSRHAELAQQFVSFMDTDDSRRILADYGFVLP